jgi:hypothetical protein
VAKKLSIVIEIVFISIVFSLAPLANAAVPSITNKAFQFLFVVLLATWSASFMTAVGVWIYDYWVMILKSRAIINAFSIIAVLESLWILLSFAGIVRHHPGIGWLYECRPLFFIAVLLISIAIGLLTKVLLLISAKRRGP